MMLATLDEKTKARADVQHWWRRIQPGIYRFEEAPITSRIPEIVVTEVARVTVAVCNRQAVFGAIKASVYKKAPWDRVT